MQAMRTGGATRVLDYGDRALLLEFDGTAEVLAWTDTLRAADLLGVVDIVPAAKTILVKLAGRQYQAPTRQRLRQVQLSEDAIAESVADGDADIVVDVTYDGDDLDDVAQLTGLTPQETSSPRTPEALARRIQRIRAGFRLSGRRRRTTRSARRSDPRTKVPVGSVGSRR